MVSAATCQEPITLIPRASKTCVDGELGDALKIRLQAPPVDGQANKALLQFLKKQLKVSGSQLALVAGAKNRSKRIRVTGLTELDIRERLT